MALVAGVLAVVAGEDDPDDRAADPPAGTTSTALPSTTTTADGQGAGGAPAWPPEGGRRFADPESAAGAFATELLGFRDPVVGERTGDTVPIRPTATGPVTAVRVQQAADGWTVLGASTDEITVTAPEAGAAITAPVAVAGRARALEGTVDVTVLADERARPIGEGFVTGGGDERRPFEGSIEFDPPRAGSAGTVVFVSASAEDGRTWQAAAVRVALAPPTGAGDDTMDVRIFFTCDDGERVCQVTRSVERSSAVLAVSLRELLAGPTTAERARGLTSPFDDRTAATLRSVSLRQDGHAVVDFEDLRPLIPNASSSAGSRELLAQLDATVFQFRTVDTAEYRLEGSCEAFTEWVQLGGCAPRTRGED